MLNFKTIDLNYYNFNQILKVNYIYTEELIKVQQKINMQ